MPDDNVDKTDLNKKDIEHLEEKVDNVYEEVKRLDSNTPSSKDFNDLKDTIDRFLIKGNGGKSIPTKVGKNKTTIDTLKARINWLYGIVATIFGGTLSLIIKKFTDLMG